MSNMGIVRSPASSTFCATFPTQLDREVSRDALLNQIDTFFANGVSLVHLEGKAEFGKTQVLAQFAKQHKHTSIATFIRPDSWCLQDPSLLYRELADQMHWALHRQDPPPGLAADERTLRSLSYALQGFAKRANKLLYLVLDGVENVAQDAGQFVAGLLRIMPTEFSQFRFLCSGNPGWIPTSLLPAKRRKQLTMTAFSLLETSFYFSDLGIEQKQLEQIYRMCGLGIPGYLASARRSLKSGITAEDLIDRPSADLQESFSLEWKAKLPEDAACVQALAILAHDKNSHSVSELASIVGTSTDELTKCLGACSFLELNPDNTPVRFVSDSFRRFASAQLAAHEASTWNLLAEYYSQNYSESTSSLLPTYLHSAGREKEILTLLSPNTFLQIAQRSDSFIPLRQQCELGRKTAMDLGRYAETVRFQLQSAVAADISQFRFSEAEVVARLSLDDYATAIRLAQAASLTRHRLQLMAAIARVQHKKGLTPETTLTSAIEALVEQLDPLELGDELVEVASDLMYVNPDLALSMFSKLTPDTIDSKNVDLALLQMTTVIASHTKADAGMSAALEDIREKITHPTAKKLAKTVSILVVDQTPEEVLRQAQSIENAGDQLFFLRQWCLQNKHPELAAPVLIYAIHLAIRTTEYLPSATDFRAFTEPLPHLQKENDIATLITTLDIQKDAIKNTGPTQDYVRWQLLIAQAEVRLNPIRSGQRLFEVYMHVSSLTELDVKTVCLGLLVASLPTVDPTGAYDGTIAIRAMVEDEFQTSYTLLLDSTADHYHICRPILDAISKGRTDLALEVIQKMNYGTRRDVSLSELAENLMDCLPANLPISRLASLLGKWSNTDEEDSSVEDMIDAISRIDDQTSLSNNWNDIEKILRRGLLVVNPWHRCAISSNILILLRRSGNIGSSLYSEAAKSVDSSWESIGEPAAKLHAGYRVAGRLADHERELAIAYLRRADDEKKGYTDLSSSTFILCIRITIRAFSGLLRRRLFVPADVERIGNLIDRVPSQIERIRLWSDLALRIHRRDHHDLLRDIVRQKLNPLLASLKERCIHEWRLATAFAAPVLYCFSPVLSEQYLADLPLDLRDAAYDNLLRYLITSMPPGEPFHRKSGTGLHLGEDKCAEILKVAHNLNMDFLVYRYISMAAEAARWQHNRFALNQLQKNQLANAINDLSRSKFPNPTCITHDGFAILAEAQGLRLLRPKQVDWSDLLTRARRLANAADRAFVLMHLADIMHTTFTDERIALFEEAYRSSLAIPSLQERAERLNLLASLMQTQNPIRAKTIVREAVTMLRTKQAGNTDELCRNLVDLAYQIDPEFASSLTSAFDHDRGRGIARGQIAYQKLKDYWKSESQSDERDEVVAHERSEKLARELLGTLNADRIPQKSFKSCVEILSRLNGSSLHSQFWTLSWALENLFEKRSNSGEAEGLLRDVFEAVLTASEVGAAVISRAAGYTVSVAPSSTREAASTVIKAGQRDRALAYLTDWFRDNGNDFLYICDPYFGRGELEAIQLIMRVKPQIQIRVLTSRRKQEQDLSKEMLPIQDAYRQYWREHFSDQDPEDCEVIVIGNAGGDLPIHERWWLTKDAGLRVGTSFNQLGVNRDSEIGVLMPVEAHERREEVEALINRQKREHLGQRLTYQVIPV